MRSSKQTAASTHVSPSLTRRCLILSAATIPLVTVLPRGSNAASPESIATFYRNLDTLATDIPALESAKEFREWEEVSRDEPTTRGRLKLPKSSTIISEEATKLIIKLEVSSRDLYEKRYRGAIWPHGQSGVTVGIGYDVGYVSAEDLASDWENRIPQKMITALSSVCGLKAAKAKEKLTELKEIDIAYDVAELQFCQELLPRYTKQTELSLRNTQALLTRSPHCLGALVSLVYNRGASFGLAGDRYKEMRQIKELMRDGKFDLIPARIEAMTRLWEGQPKMKGLLERRRLEAQLFRIGLQS